MTDVIDLLGRRHDDPVVTDFVSGSSAPEFSTIEDTSHISAPDRGFDLLLRGHEEVTGVRLYGSGDSAVEEYPGLLPGDLNFEANRQEVRALLGVPLRSGETQTLPVLGIKPPWDLFEAGDHKIHVEYDFGADRVHAVTVTF